MPPLRLRGAVQQMRGDDMQETPQQLKALPPPLLAWYDANRRVLP